MTNLKLIKARSYTGSVKATAKHPYVNVETDEEAQALIGTGYFELCSSSPALEATPDAGGKVPDAGSETPDYEALSKMSKVELTEFAEKNGVDIEGCKTKDDILQAISAANGGSFTIMGLQEEK